MIKCTECNEPVHDKETGLCDKHYKRYKRHGNPFAVYGVDESMQSDSCHECGQPAKVKSKGLCSKCYKRWQRKNKPIQIKQPQDFSIKPFCAGIGCEKEAVSLGYCQTHYMRLRKHGDPETVLPSVKPRQHWTCTVEGCGREHVARGLCQRHLGKFYRIREREELLNAYGHTCQCCGESRSEFLALDHIDKSGYKDRKNGRYSRRLHQWLKKQGYPKDNYRLLCHNCNQSLGHYGYCPHKKHPTLSRVESFKISQYPDIGKG